MPHYILHLCWVIVHVDVSFRDTDTPETDRKTRPYNLHSVCACVTSNINSAACRMGPCTTAPPSFVPCWRTVCAIQYERNTGQFSGCVQFVECVLCHLLHRAGRRTAFELTLREIPSCLHVLRELGVYHVHAHPLVRQGRGLQWSYGRASA